MTVPVYIAEMSPSQLRGQLVTINTLFITGGQFIASVVDGAFSYAGHNGWRYKVPKDTEIHKKIMSIILGSILGYPCPECFIVSPILVNFESVMSGLGQV